MKKLIIAALALALIAACLTAGCGEKPGQTSQSLNLNTGQENETAETTSAQSTTTPSSPSPPADTQPPSSSGTSPDQPSPSEASSGQAAPESEPPRPEKYEDQIVRTIQATITMENGGVIVLELYPDLAPQSVRNFVYLARSGFYDGLKFHRIMKDFMIQGGCPLGTGTGDPGYSIFGEFTSNGFKNGLSHKRGVISMARANDPNSAGSQFFIVHGDSEFLDGSYAAFGRVVSGMDVVDEIAKTPNSGDNGAVAEKNKPVMKSITIDDDIELPEPERLERR